MKKNYMTPEMKVAVLHVSRMLMTSVQINSTGDAVDASDAAGREFWDDVE